MTLYYLARPDGSYSDAADYELEPESREDGQWIEGLPLEDMPVYKYKSLNQSLVEAFSSFLPKHIGQSYCTPDVIASIWNVKLAVTDANNSDPSGTIAKAIINSLELPQQMEADKQAIVALFP